MEDSFAATLVSFGSIKITVDTVIGGLFARHVIDLPDFSWDFCPSDADCEIIAVRIAALHKRAMLYGCPSFKKELSEAIRRSYAYKSIDSCPPKEFTGFIEEYSSDGVLRFLELLRAVTALYHGPSVY